MSNPKSEPDPPVRINVILPLSERRAFDRACHADPPTTMNWRIRELIAADAAGRLDLPRDPPPPRGKTDAPKPTPKRRTAPPPSGRGPKR